MTIYVTGVSGTGKTSIAKELSKKGISSISIDEIDGLCSWVNISSGKYVDYEAELTADFIKKHEWVCSRPMLEEIIANVNDDVIVLGLADNYDQLKSLFDKVVLLQASPEVFIKRIQQRTDNDFGKDQSAQEYLLSNYKEYEAEMISEGAVVVDAEKSLADVVSDIIHLFDE